jgi:hypothetical protein
MRPVVHPLPFRPHPTSCVLVGGRISGAGGGGGGGGVSANEYGDDEGAGRSPGAVCTIFHSPLAPVGLHRPSGSQSKVLDETVLFVGSFFVFL